MQKELTNADGPVASWRAFQKAHFSGVSHYSHALFALLAYPSMLVVLWAVTAVSVCTVIFLVTEFAAIFLADLTRYS